ncbi:Gfo/Idh/MocA family protein [Muriicola sp. Z0-33]|uniref:Gfo/Idh/MocA family protein n=1 Tax=Muriicola sp. Z0-33 TaxID=2816957 RepID=UPI00223894AF|nr:Gfo/Idh/MocA family oxidoreductase [Muriicola sp. Z0-33]MCW5516613.1 Gfo/Idh/MocA family oxidoreductase [Muriicola sp. Z0-33]
MTKTIGWGIIGLGNIAHSFAKDLELVNGGRLVGVASRSLDKAVEFGNLYKADYQFGSYEELFRCKEIDVVYIATPHTSHAELSVMAMNMGKGVLCEKPFGINSLEVEKMIAAAEQNGVFLMEAMWSRFNPSIKKVKQLIAEGNIGKVGYLHADFAFYALDRSEQGRLLNPALAGGSLLDIGIYPIFLSYLMLGSPDSIEAISNFHTTGVEVQTSMIFNYPSAQALLYSGLNSNSEMKAQIAGSEGSLFLHSRWHQSQGYSLEKDGELHQFELPTTGKGYSHEIEEVHHCLNQNQKQSKLWSLEDSRNLMAIMDEIRQKCGISFPSEV